MEMPYSNMELIIAMSMAVVMVVLTILVHYEVLYYTSRTLPRLPLKNDRLRMIFVMLGAFLAHVIEIWLFAICFWVMYKLELGNLAGEFYGGDHWRSYLYFSTVSYTSLGLGDIYPQGPMRLMTGVEGLVGLVMIGWSASFTYLVMDKFWRLHRRPTFWNDGGS